MPVARYLQNVSLDPRVTPEVMGALTQAESSGNPNAVSPRGAQGLAQLMPGTAQDLGVDPFNPSEALAGAKKYLSYLLKQTGNLPDALASYNMGLSAFKKRGPNLPRETQDYVKKVMQLMGQKDAGQSPSVAAAPLNAGDSTPTQNPPDAAPSSPPSVPQIGDGNGIAMPSGVGVGAMPKFSGYGKITPPPSQFTGSANPIAMVETLLRDPLALSQGTPMAAGGFVKLPSRKHVPSKAFGFNRMQSSVAGPSVSDGEGMAKGGSIKKLISAAVDRLEAHSIASKNAEKMLGLPPGNTAMDRAKAMGFRDNPVYHGTAADIDRFDQSRSTTPQGKQAIYATEDPEVASEFAEMGGQGANVLPLRYRAGKQAQIDLPPDVRNLEVAATLDDALNDLGYDAVKLNNYTTPAGKTGKKILAVKSPSQLRSTFAAFDPAKKDSSDILAGVAGLGVLPLMMGSWDDDKGYAEGGAVIRSAPRGKVLGALSDAARYIDENALQPIQHRLERIPVGFTGTAGDYTSGRSSGLLGLLAPRFNSLADVLNEASYGMPITTGSGMTTGLKPEVGFAALDASQLNNLRPLVKGAKNLGKKVASKLDRPDVIESMFGPEDEWNAAKANWDAAQGYAGGGAVRGALLRLSSRAVARKIAKKGKKS